MSWTVFDHPLKTNYPMWIRAGVPIVYLWLDALCGTDCITDYEALAHFAGFREWALDASTNNPTFNNVLKTQNVIGARKLYQVNHEWR